MGDIQKIKQRHPFTDPTVIVTGMQLNLSNNKNILWSPLVEIVDAQLKDAVTRAVLNAFHKMDAQDAPASGRWW